MDLLRIQRFDASPVELHGREMLSVAESGVIVHASVKGECTKWQVAVKYMLLQKYTTISK